jgi:uncharacterized protein
MTNKEIILKVNEGFCGGDTEKTMQYIADDVRCEVTGSPASIGTEALRKETGKEYFIGLPTIKIKAVFEKDDWVAVEGEVQCNKADGGILNAFFFDVYLLEKGKIKELRSYIIERNKSFYKNENHNYLTIKM